MAAPEPVDQREFVRPASSVNGKPLMSLYEHGTATTTGRPTTLLCGDMPRNVRLLSQF